MVARVTLAEIDVMRISIADAVRRFEEQIAPALRERDGFAGVYVLATPDGKALVMTLWESDEAADAALGSGFYAEQVSRFVTLYRSPPGREIYDVVFADAPAVAWR